ncbi:MAG: sigma-54-dependent Fis family transcriptional regulator [Burkholderiales bacterium RIFCSPHIGHO2_12_FULL_69_20]|nr:MAG: sigma-54-dependent Fis family transcriptional regulator [Burkholderiales bacterium RIFCSPHIGHO2_12_FULL_69_20]
MTSTFSLLVVDDEPDLRTLYELTLLREGYDVDSAGSVEEAWSRLGERSYNAVITDMRLPDGNGLDLLRRLDAAQRAEKTIVITAYGSAENAVEALKAGAFDYLTKPVDLRQFRSVVASALGRGPVAEATPAARPPGAGARSGAARQAALAAQAASEADRAACAAAAADAPGSVAAPHPALQRLAGASPAMQQVRSLIERVARGMAPVMVQGESGTGKELVARALHEVSPRAAQPFIAVNCGAIPEQLLEAEFFGYRKGAFTGAAEDRQGFFQAAQGGTLFLDEIGDLPLAMQSKLLRAIQERSVRQIGAVSEQPVNVRIVSATHKDLASEVHEGRFRQDLYYRLNVIQVRMPPLRERVDDLGLICAAVLERIAREAGVSPPPRLSDDAMAGLARYGFPGNVRELENLLHRAVTLASSEVISGDDLGLGDEAFVDSEWQALEAPPAEPVPPTVLAGEVALPADLVAHLDAVERAILIRALAQHRFNRTAAGSSLGLSLRQMRYRMARLGIQVAEHGTE